MNRKPGAIHSSRTSCLSVVHGRPCAGGLRSLSSSSSSSSSPQNFLSLSFFLSSRTEVQFLQLLAIIHKFSTHSPNIHKRDEQFFFLLLFLWIPEVRRLKGCCLVTFLLQLLSDLMLCAKNMNKKNYPKKHL
jgi:hypothetical protein